MTFERIVAWLNVLGLEPTSLKTDTWVNVSCPVAKWRHEKGRDTNPSFGVRSSGKPGIEPVKCFACGFSGSQLTLLYELKEHGAKVPFKAALTMLEAEEHEGSLALTAPSFDEFKKRLTVPLLEFPEELRESMEPAYTETDVHPYLRERRVGPRVAALLDLRWDVHQQRIVFPIRDWDGVLRGLHGRLVVKPYWLCRKCRLRFEKPPKGKKCPKGHGGLAPSLPYKMYPLPGTAKGEHRNNPVVWLGEHLVDPEQPVVVVESVFDMASVLRVYDNVAAPLTASFGIPKAERFDRCTDLVHMFDGDKAGRDGSDHLRAWLPDSRHRVVTLDDGLDPGNLAPSQIRSMLLPLKLALRAQKNPKGS